MQILFSSRSFRVNLGASKSSMESTDGNYFAESNTKFELPVHVRNGTAATHRCSKLDKFYRQSG